MKGQIQHAFTFTLFILIAGFVLIIGYGAISKLMGQSCDLEKTQFQEKISRMFDRYDNYGSLHREDIPLPCGADMVCFVDGRVYNNTALSVYPSQPAGNIGAQNIIRTANDTKYNIFLIDDDLAEPAGFSDKIMLQNPRDDFCFDGPTAKMELRGQGQGALVVKP